MRLLTLALLLVSAISRADEPSKDELLKFEKQLQAAHKSVGPSLACIVVSRSDQYPKPAQPQEPWRLGGFDRAAFLKANTNRNDLADRLDLSNVQSIPDHGFAGGVVIDSAGLVLTHYHTVEGATKIYVHLAGGNGSYADVRAADARCDLAVLKLQNSPADLKAIRIGKVALLNSPDARGTIASGQVGLLMALPFTAGTLNQPKSGLATIGQIKMPELKADPGILFRSAYNYAPLLDFESRFSPGASGAVFLNREGELIGLTSTTAGLATEPGRGFAVAMDENFTRLIEVLRRGEEIEYGFLGVVRPNFPQRGRGIPIEGMPSRGSPAALAGLQANDLITRINDVPVSTFEDLLLHVGHGLAGRRITLSVQRFNQPAKDIEVTLAKFKNEMPFIASVKPEPVFGLRVDYGSVLTQALVFNPFGGRNLFDIPPGVLASELLPDSPAAAKFKELGDNTRWVITHVNGRATATPAEFYQEARGKKTVRLTVVDPAEGRNRSREVTLP